MNDVEPARCKGRVNVGEHTLLVTLFTFKGDLLLVGTEQLCLLLSVFWIFKYVYVCTLLAGTGKPARVRGVVVVVVINTPLIKRRKILSTSYYQNLRCSREAFA